MGHLINARGLRLGWTSLWSDEWFSPFLSYASFMFSMMRQRAILRMFLYSRRMDKSPYIFSHFNFVKSCKFIIAKIYFYYIPFTVLIQKMYTNLYTFSNSMKKNLRKSKSTKLMLKDSSLRSNFSNKILKFYSLASSIRFEHIKEIFLGYFKKNTNVYHNKSDLLLMTASKEQNLQSISLKVRKKKNLSLFFKKFWALVILKLSPLSCQLSNITKFAQLYNTLEYYSNLKRKKPLKSKKDIFVKKRLTKFSNIYNLFKNNEFTNSSLFYYLIWKRLIDSNFSNKDLSFLTNDKSCYNLNFLINSFINIDYSNYIDNYYNQYFDRILKYWSMYLIYLNDLLFNTAFISRIFHLSIHEFSNRLNLLFVFDYLSNRRRTIESTYTDVNGWDFGNWLVRDTNNSFDVLTLQNLNLSFDLNIKYNQFIKFLVQLLNIREQAIDKHLNLSSYKNNKFLLSNKNFLI